MQRTAFSLQEVTQMRGRFVFDANGEKIGSLDGIYLDNDTRRPEWIGLSTGSLAASTF